MFYLHGLTYKVPKAKIFVVWRWTTSLYNIFSSCLIVYMIGLKITIITVILQIIKYDLSLKKPIAIFYMIVIWLEKVWLVNKYVWDEDNF